MNFEVYTECIFRSFCVHQKQQEILKRKSEILNEVATFHNFTPKSILYVGFNPAILVEDAEDIYVCCVSDEIQDYLKSQKIKFNNVKFSELSSYNKFFDAVIILDEFFTFAKSDNEQKEIITLISSITKEYFITTCKDYKNQEFKDREFSLPALIRNTNKKIIYLEFHDHDIRDKNTWTSEVFEINEGVLNTYGPFARKALFFKQLAKFSSDAGAVGFTVHKNLMYKSLIKKNYEHVISIRFDNYGYK
jgi:hypothetical protein